MAFSDTQTQAIAHKDGPALVLAGPGSGKTTVITNRIVTLLERYHIPGSRILVITFTRAAAQEMQSRFYPLPEEKRPFGCSTLHGRYFWHFSLCFLPHFKACLPI